MRDNLMETYRILMNPDRIDTRMTFPLVVKDASQRH